MDSIVISTKNDQPTNCNNDETIGKATNGNSTVSDSKNNNQDQQKQQQQQDESTTSETQKDDSSTFSTAFTISFEDDNNASKKLGIKDSIRKFAPPKPHTIEKPRQPKSDQCQDNSLASIESAPAGLSKHSPLHHHNNHRKGNSNSSRSSSRRSNSSRHSNISDSAAFLIDKMLNFKQQSEDEELVQSIKHTNKHGTKASQNFRSSSERANEIDFCEDKSDNGTYIVEEDPENEAARKKIDELFGVVRAAEASIIADSTSIENRARQSRSLLEKKQLRERQLQEHMNRLACRTSPSSVSRGSSSSSHQDNLPSVVAVGDLNQHQRHNRQPRASSRHSRNSSCDRTTNTANQISHNHNRPKRSASQTSRQSSNRELSDGDTRSSKSSLHNNDNDVLSQENPLSTHPNMKFNRAFALRRARLGLGEPGTQRLTSAQSSISQESDSVNNLSSSQRRHQINTNTYRANQQNHAAASGSGANFSRNDGGRFSLRTKNGILPSRLSSANQHTLASNRSPQHHGNLLDSYINKVSATKLGAAVSLQNQDLSRTSKIPHSPYISANLPYTSSDELDPISPSKYRLLLKAGRTQQQQPQQHKKGSTEQESDTPDFHNNNRFNYIGTGIDYDNANNSYSFSESRAGSSIGRRESALQLGALDSLVISAISSLSLKIRSSVCDVLIEQAKKLPAENETRLIVEEILPQLTAGSSSSKSPTSIEEIDQSLYFDLAKTLKNLKKVEQMVDVISQISNQLPSVSANSSITPSTSLMTSNAILNQKQNFKTTIKVTGKVRSSENITTANTNRMNDLSPI